jgi:outer membrane protein assembly factor BamE (lipoprotein component of BamABCDE complex)
MRWFSLLVMILLAACTSTGEFDAERWKNADLTTRERVEMVDALQRQHPLKGMTRSEIVRLLGEPTPTDKWDEWDIIYVLGPTDYMPIDHEWLVIELDERGRVSRYRVTSD